MMIAPRGRLLLAFAIVAWPALTIASLSPAVGLLCGVVLALVVLFVIADALFSRDRLRAVRVDAPEFVRFAKLREGAVEIRLTNDSDQSLRGRIAIALPA